MVQSPIDQVLSILSASIAPVIVISGVGLVLLSMTNRHSHVIDRARELAKDLEHVDAPERRDLIIEQLQILYRRARILRIAIVLSSISILFVGLTIFAIFGARLLGITTDYVSLPSFGFCLIALLGSLYFFIRDVTLSLTALELELGRYLKTD